LPVDFLQRSQLEGVAGPVPTSCPDWMSWRLAKIKKRKIGREKKKREKIRCFKKSVVNIGEPLTMGLTNWDDL
jgi:hypothetical protein